MDMLPDEIRLINCRVMKSERLIVFLAVLLQRDAMVKSRADIHRLLCRRMTLWQEGHIDILIGEFEHCAKRFSKLPTGTMDEAHVIKVFMLLMWRGQVRSAVRWVTEASVKWRNLGSLSCGTR